MITKENMDAHLRLGNNGIPTDLKNTSEPFRETGEAFHKMLHSLPLSCPAGPPFH